jgi:hypothetical protein
MHFLILLALLASVHAASAETLTLADGRVLTGVYDPATGMLDLGMGKIAIAPADIASRKPAEPVPTKLAKAERAEAELLGEGPPANAEDRARRLALLQSLLRRNQDQLPAIQATLDQRRTATAAARTDRDLRAVSDGDAARRQANDEGRRKCWESIPNAEGRTIEEWGRRFEARAQKTQEAKQTAAERRLAKAVAEEKSAADNLAASTAKAAELQASIDKLATP